MEKTYQNYYMNKKKTKIPPNSLPNNVSTEDFLLALDNICKRLANKFRFAYHSIDDMKQQAAIFALEGLKNYDKSRPLENFLWTHVRNRLFNYKRDHYQRPDKPCLTCPFYDSKCSKSSSECTEFSNKNECSLYSSWLKRNDAKKNIMKPIGLDLILDYPTKHSEDQTVIDIQNKEIIDIIDNNISTKNRPIFLKLQGNIKISKPELQKLLVEIKKILKKHDIQT